MKSPQELCFLEGWLAFQNDKPFTSNPYKKTNQEQSKAWESGWNSSEMSLESYMVRKKKEWQARIGSTPSGESTQKQQDTTTWSAKMVSDLRDLCKYSLMIPIMITGKQTSVSFGQESTEYVTYYGFIPYKGGLDDVELSLRGLGTDEPAEGEYQDKIGYIKIYDGWKPIPYTMTVFIRQETGLLDAIGKLLNEAKVFNPRSSVNLELEIEYDWPEGEIDPNEIKGKELPIKRVSLNGNISLPRTAEKRAIQKKSKSRGWKKYVSYAWLVLGNILALLVAFLLFGIASTSFDIVMLAILTLVYVAIYYSRLTSAEFYLKSQKQYIHLLQLLNDPMLDDDYMQDTILENERLSNEVGIKVVINYIFLGILSLTALWKIVNSVFGFL